MTSRRLIAIRHGQTDWNAAGRFQGQTDVPMNEEGRRQVKAAATALAALNPTGMVSSDLSRAVDTAQAIADQTGITFTTDERLREIYVGSWEGLTRAEIAERFPDEWARWNRREPVARGGGETNAECAARVGAAILEHLRNDRLGETVVIVGHGMALHASLDLLREQGHVDFDYPITTMGNAEWVEARIL